MKKGDKAIGFRFESFYLSYDPEMESFCGVEGTVAFVEQDYDKFMIEFIIEGASWRWWYPLSEYIEKRREEKLRELGI